MALHGAVPAGVGVMAVAASFLSAFAGTWSVSLLAAALFAVAWVMVYRTVPQRPPNPGKAVLRGTLPSKAPLILLGVAAGLIIAAETAALLW